MPISDELSKQLAANARSNADMERREAAQRVINACYGGPFWKEDFGQVLRKIFRDEDKADRPLLKLSLVEHFGSVAAGVFQKRPTFEVRVNGETSKEQTALLAWIFESGRWWDRLRTANLHEALLSTIHLWPRRFEDHLELEVVSPAASWVVQNERDPQRADAVVFRRAQQVDTPNQYAVKNERWVYWGQQHFVFEIDGNDRIKEITSPVDNPYRFEGDHRAAIPVKVSRIDPPDDEYWAQPALDVVMTEESVNAQAMALGEGVINAGFQITWSEGIDEGKFKNGRGPGTHYAVTGRKEGDPPVQFGSVDLRFDVEGAKLAIEFLIQMQAVLKGLPPQAFRIDTSAESGFAKMADRIEFMKDEGEDRERWGRVMDEVFEATKRIWNVEQARGADDASGVDLGGEGDFDEEAELYLDWPEDKPTESEMDRLARVKEQMAMGLLSPVGALQELNPDLSDEDAEAKLREIRAQTERFNAEGLLRSVGLER